MGEGPVGVDDDRLRPHSSGGLLLRPRSWHACAVRPGREARLQVPTMAPLTMKVAKVAARGFISRRL